MLVRAFRGASYSRSAIRGSRIMSTTSGRPEIKLIDGLAATPGGNNLALSTTGVITPVNLIASGSGFNNRIGRKIEMQSLHVTGLITQTGTATTQNDYARICVVYDRQTNGAVPAYTDIFQNYSATSVTSSTAFSGINPDERERFVILADVRLVLPATPVSGINGTTDGLSTTFNINRFIKLNNLSVMYKGDSAVPVIGDVATGALYITTIGSFAPAAQGYATILSWRLRYKDT